MFGIVDMLHLFKLFPPNCINWFIITGETEHLASGFEGSTSSPSMIALAFYDGLWAYDGW